MQKFRRINCKNSANGCFKSEYNLSVAQSLISTGSMYKYIYIRKVGIYEINEEKVGQTYSD